MFKEFGNTDRVLRETERYMDENPSVLSRLSEIFSAHDEISDLFPQTAQKFVSGSYFPMIESKTELNISLFLMKRGLYRHAFVSLRTVLELGLLSVYWDRGDRSEIEISDWLGSNEDTPFMRIVRRELKSIPNVAAYNKHDDLFGKNGSVQRLYKQLNNFAHVKGLQYSVGMLGDSKIPGSGVAEFSNKTLTRWIELAEEVIKIVIVVHLLKYPIGLQETPMDDKFGSDGPSGGFLNPWQAEQLREFVGKPTATILQSISDADTEAVEFARQIRARPDIWQITEEYRQQEELEKDKLFIESVGFLTVLKGYQKADPDQAERFSARSESLKSWASERGWVKSGRFGPLA